MSSSEFWDLTLEELHARIERYRQEQKRWDIRFGVIAANYINTKLKEGAPRVKPGDFFGHTDGQEMDDGEEMTPEQTINHCQAMFRVK